MIKVITDDIEKFAIELGQMSDTVRSDVQKVLKNTGFKIESKAKLNLNNNRSVKTGHLMRSISTDVGNMEVTVHTSNVKYARLVEEGTRPHVIRAKGKRALYWKGARQPVRKVNHPGSRAKPYLIPAFESEKEGFIKELKKVIEW